MDDTHYIEEVRIDDWSGPGCPIGQCLTFLPRSWDRTTLSLCVVDPWDVYTLADNRRFIDDAIAVWANGPMTLTQVTNCNAADILIDWDPFEADILGESPPPPSDGSQITIRMIEVASQGPGGETRACSWNAALQCQRRHSPHLTLAHEIGHALGIGHSEFRDALMFPAHRLDCQATVNPNVWNCSSVTAGLHADDVTALERLYGGTTTAVAGFEKNRFSVTNGSRTIVVPYPAGSSAQSILCLVDTWIPSSHLNGWTCSWTWDNTNRRASVTVTAEGGEVGGLAIVLDDAFIHADYYPFDLGGSWVSSEISVPSDPGTISLVQYTRYRSQQDPFQISSATQAGFTASSSNMFGGPDDTWQILLAGEGSQVDLMGHVVVLRPGVGVNGSAINTLHHPGVDCIDQNNCPQMPLTSDDHTLVFAAIQGFSPAQTVEWTKDCNDCEPSPHVADPRLSTYGSARIETGACTSGSLCVWTPVRVGGGGTFASVEFISVYFQQ